MAQATYATALKLLISNMRSALSAPNMWFIINGMVPETISGATAVIDAAHQQVATQTDHCAYVAGPSGYANGVHYLAQGYRILGAKAAIAVQAARRYLAPSSNATAVVISPSLSSVVVNNPVTVNVTTDNPLTGSQTQQVTLTAPMAGNWSPSNVVNLSASTPTAAPTFTPTQTGSGNITATVTGTLSISANSPALASTAAATAPGAVTGLTAGTATSSTQPLTWTAPSSGTAPITYKVEYSPAAANTWTQAATGVSASNYTVTGLTASTAYDYRVTPSNTAGNGTAATLSNVSTAAAVATYATWDTAFKASSLTLSNGNLTATSVTGSPGAWESTRSTVGKTSGKWYWEVTCGNTPSLIGVAGATSFTTSNFTGETADSWGYYNTPAAYHGGGSISGVTPVAYGAGDIIGVELDMDNKTVEWFRNGASIGKATGLPAGPMYAAATTKDGSPAGGFTANFGQTAFSRTPNAGFVGLA